MTDPILFRALPHECSPKVEMEPSMATEWTEFDELDWLIREILTELEASDEHVVEVERRLLKNAVTYLTGYRGIIPALDALEAQAKEDGELND